MYIELEEFVDHETLRVIPFPHACHECILQQMTFECIKAKGEVAHCEHVFHLQ